MGHFSFHKNRKSGQLGLDWMCVCVCTHTHTHSHRMFHSELDCTFTTCSSTCLSFDEFYREPVGFSIFLKERNETQACLHLSPSEYNTLRGCCNFSWRLPGTQIRCQHAWAVHLISSSQDGRIVKLISPSHGILWFNLWELNFLRMTQPPDFADFVCLGLNRSGQARTWRRTENEQWKYNGRTSANSNIHNSEEW